MIPTRNGYRLYVDNGLAFLAKRLYVNAWGWTCVEGTLFDLEEGGAPQRNAVAHCNIPAPESEIIAHAMKEAR